MKRFIPYFILIAFTLVAFSPLVFAQDRGLVEDYIEEQQNKNPRDTRTIDELIEDFERLQAGLPLRNSTENPATAEGPASFGTTTEQTGGTASLSWLVTVATNIARGIIDWITAIAGGVVVLMIIWGGILYMQGNTEAGKKTILAAIVGTVIILLAFFLVNVFKSIIGA